MLMLKYEIYSYLFAKNNEINKAALIALMTMSIIERWYNKLFFVFDNEIGLPTCPLNF